MTVKELIDKLQTLEQDKEIGYYGYDSYIEEFCSVCITNITLEDNEYVIY